MLVPSYKIGYAASLEEALKIIQSGNMLQDHGKDGKGNPIPSTPCGVWPTGVPMQPDSNFVAASLEGFEILCTLGLENSPQSKIVIMEVEHENDVPDEKIAARIQGAGNTSK